MVGEGRSDLGDRRRAIEVDELDVAVLGQQHVPGMHIAVHDTRLVHSCDDPGQSFPQVQNLAGTKSTLSEHVGQDTLVTIDEHQGVRVEGVPCGGMSCTAGRVDTEEVTGSIPLSSTTNGSV
ncbi:hypothetical protein RM445_25325 [Pseudonocardia sp. DSM 45834]|uniref:Uncharacterized protein n=1 Tax=Pseudonocardia charpentierae TaxID=3075545 RepID=A0ABU2NFW7_9PSEU|nr:hypothetical protein [Pseudonocardia sp. DSM 45834]MDT0352847.1 hypothetical protein [Pseudonocardia sp. DSM 45834]